MYQGAVLTARTYASNTTVNQVRLRQQLGSTRRARLPTTRTREVRPQRQLRTHPGAVDAVILWR
jgi:hypothetical protein